jgi:hypothetical protein
LSYGDDITEGIPSPLGNPISIQAYTPTGVAYDIAIGGQPFFINNDDNNPYRRVTAQYRKNQVDMSREPGEQTITGWWLRSQSSFHLGQGIKFYEPAQDEALRFQFTDTKGCNVWERGQVTLLNDVDSIHITTDPIRSNRRPWQFSRSIKWTSNGNTYQGLLLSDGFDVDKIYPTISASVTNKSLTANVATLTTSSTHGLSVGMEVEVTGVDATFNGTYELTAVTSNTISYAKIFGNIASTAVSPPGSVTSEVVHFVNYISGTNDPVHSICDDGVFAFWVTNDTASGKLAVYKKLLSAGPSVAPTLMFNKPGITVTNAVIEYVKERLVMAVNNSVYEFATTATSLPTAVYTHPTNDYTYTSISSSGAAIYLSGYSGIQTTIQKFTLNTSSGSMPTLTSAITAAELPAGEVIFKIFFYLDVMCIGTSAGVRIALVNSSDGSLAYGPLLFESEQPVYDFAARDRYVWCTTNVDGHPGVTRIDLGQKVENLVYAYAWDLLDATRTGFNTTTCAFLGDTSLLTFATANNGTSNGIVYIQSATRLVPQGTLHTGYVRYNTLENKIFKYITPRCNTANGSLQILSVDSDGSTYNVGFFTQETEVGDVPISYPPGAQQYLGFQFILSRSDVDSTKGPFFTGYQLKSLLAVPRQRLIQFPVECYDSESDKFGNKAGYDGAAFDKLQTLEGIESNGDTIKIEDFRTGETLTGIIEELDFLNKTPTDKRYSGYGGLLLITIRTMS